MRGMLTAGAALLCAGLAAEVVTYEQYGAAGDGRTDDQAAIAAAHAAANAKGLPVKAGDGKTYYIGGGDTVAVIRTDTDFGTAKFIIDDVKLKNRNRPVFRVEPSEKPFDVKGVTALARGQTNLGVRLPADCLLDVRNDKVRQYIRLGLNQNNGFAQREVLLADRAGGIDPRAPVVCDFREVTSVKAYPVDARTLTIKGGTFTTVANRWESKYDYHARNIQVQRSNVRVEGLTHYVTGEGDHGAPYDGFVSVTLAANVTVTGCVFTAHRTYRTIGSAGKPVSMGSYDITANASVNVSYIDCRQTTDINDTRYWGLLGSNYCKNMLYDGCVFSRFDAHMGVANATIRNSRLGHMGINAIGFGTFLVENTTVHGRNFFNLRSDYGSTWEGEFIVRDCVYAPPGGRPGVLVNGHNTGKHDFGYPCFMPRKVTFENLRIADTTTSTNYHGPYVFNQINGDNKSAAYVEDFPYHVTEELVLKNVTTASGKPVHVTANTWMFRDLKVTREDAPACGAGAYAANRAKGMKTPETSKLFVKHTDAESGVVSYLLKPGLIDGNQQSVYFTSKSMTDDGRFIVLDVSRNEFAEGARRKSSKRKAVVDLMTDTFAVLDGIGGQIPFIDPGTDRIYYFRNDAAKGGDSALCRRDLLGDPAKEIRLCAAPAALTARGEVLWYATHLTLNRDRTKAYLDASIRRPEKGADGRPRYTFVQGLLDITTGVFDEWGETSELYINHGQINPARDDVSLNAWEGLTMRGDRILSRGCLGGSEKAKTYTDITEKTGGIYPRLQLMWRGRREMVPPASKYATHERWNEQGDGFYWCAGGVWHCDLATRAQEEICPIGTHAMLSADRRCVVSDHSVGPWYRGCAWSVWFWNRAAGNGVYIHTTRPHLCAKAEESCLHPDPHPQFVCGDRYVICTVNNADGHMDFSVTPVAPLVARTAAAPRQEHADVKARHAAMGKAYKAAHPGYDAAAPAK